jgi:hypothetical protein
VDVTTAGMNKLFSMLLLLVAAFSVNASADVETDHVDFIWSHHLAGSINPEFATREIVLTPKGLPVSIIIENGGISTYLTTKDGAVIHTFIKPNRVAFGIPEGVEIALNVSIQASPVIEFHRVYGVFELGTIKADVKSVIANLRSKEWRETTMILGKMVLCAQATKLPARIGKVLGPVCAGY